MEEQMMNEVAEAAVETGLKVVEMPPMPEAKGMNGWVVAGVAAGSTALGAILMWGVPKLFGKAKAAISKKKAEETPKIEEKPADVDGEEDSDEE